MNIFRQLTEKPWMSPGVVGDISDSRISSLSAEKFGLRAILLVITVLFSVLLVSYTERMELSDWRPMPEPWLLWLNTVILVLSSIALQRAKISAGRGQRDGVKSGLFAGAFLALAFLVGQLVVWQQLIGLGYYAATNPANIFFYLITTLHGLHMLGGLVALARATHKMSRGSDVAQVRLSVELCATYWHFLLLVWVVIFGLLLVT